MARHRCEVELRRLDARVEFRSCPDDSFAGSGIETNLSDPMNERIRLAAIQLQQYEKTFYLVRMRAADLGRIVYASVRGQHDEAGAVQRF